MAKKYYSINDILKTQPDIAIIDGGRNIGKTYSLLINYYYKNCLKSNGKEGTFAYIRRKRDEITNEKVDAYVDRPEIKSISNGRWDGCKIRRGYGKKFYFYKILQTDKGIEYEWSDYPVGIAMCLYNADDYKSLDFAWISGAILEEYQTNGYYIDNEVAKTMSIYSTLRREKKRFILFMVANTISRINPYVDAFGLTKYRTQEKGTIDVYKLYRGVFNEDGTEKYYIISREYCIENEDELDSKTSKELLKTKRKRLSTMISRGDWEETYTYNVCTPTKEELANNIYTCYFIHDDVAFKIRFIYDDELMMYYPYITPYNKNKISNAINDRVISDTSFYVGMLYTKTFNSLSEGENKLFNLIKNHSRFPTNLCGNEFFQCYDNI